MLLIIKYVLENPKILRTPLAQKINRNYLQLKKYLAIMELTEIITLEEDENEKTFIHITELGKRIFRRSNSDKSKPTS